MAEKHNLGVFSNPLLEVSPIYEQHKAAVETTRNWIRVEKTFAEGVSDRPQVQVENLNVGAIPKTTFGTHEPRSSSGYGLQDGPGVDVTTLSPPLTASLIDKVLNIVDVLRHLRDPKVRRAFLHGKITSPFTESYLRSMDDLDTVMNLKAYDGKHNQRSILLANVVLQEQGEPADVHGQYLPVRMTNREWDAYLQTVCSSHYWSTKREYDKDECIKRESRKDSIQKDSNSLQVPSSGKSHGSPRHSNYRKSKLRNNSSDSSSSDVTKIDKSIGDLDSSSSSDSSVSKVSSRNRLPRRKRHREVDADSLVRALQSLGRQRDVVPPSVYDGKGFESLAQFLEEFEEYFNGKYAGTDKQCAKHLRKFLQGPPKKMYDAIDGNQRRYSDIKRKLIEWDRSQRSHTLDKTERIWENTKMEAEETLMIYALRLERLAGKLYKSRKERERQLIRKTMKTVPVEFREVLVRHDRDLPASGNMLNWDYVKRLAAGHDRHSTVIEECLDDAYDSPVEVFFSRPELAKVVSKDRDRKFRIGNEISSHGKSPPQQINYSKQCPTSPRNTKGNFVCHWCGKNGHTEDRCWLKAGCCLICGDAGHTKEECQRYEEREMYKFSPTCSGCGGDHLGRDCPLISSNC